MNNAVLVWLNAVIRERFGPAVSLYSDTHEGRTRTVLQAEGRPNRLFFSHNPDLYDAGKPLSHAVLDVSVPGLTGPTALPAPGAEARASGAGPVLGIDGENNAFCDYDCIGLIFRMLCRVEETGPAELDEHDRFPATASHAFAHGYLERPLVDEWLLAVRAVMERIWPGLPLTTPEFRMSVSHDVDTISRYGFRPLSGMLRTAFGDIIKRGDFRNALRAPRYWQASRTALHRDDPTNTFDWLMDLSDRNGVQSTFNFICGRTHPRRDARYDIGDPAVDALMQHIHARGHAIGLHPSYNAYADPAVIAAELDTLRQACARLGIDAPVRGGRMHYLRWSHPGTLRAWADAGLDYDSTLGFADLPGFRCGTCFEYPGFDPVALEPLAIRVRPLIAMDCTVVADRYLGLGTGAEAIGKFAALKNACKTVGGRYELLWHNSFLDDADHRTVYASNFG